MLLIPIVLVPLLLMLSTSALVLSGALVPAWQHLRLRKDCILLDERCSMALSLAEHDARLIQTLIDEVDRSTSEYADTGQQKRQRSLAGISDGSEKSTLHPV